ncbi:MAG: RNA polymerase factor sigma-54 [Rikenellaceae bacterium]
MALSQVLTQNLQQKLSPQQIQGIKLLELPTLALEQRIAREIEENIVLEEDAKKSEDNQEQDTTLEDYIKAEQNTASYKLRSNNYSADDENRPRQISGGKSLADYLLEQLVYSALGATQLQIARFIVGSLDDDGYLHRSNYAIADDIAFKLALEIEEDQIESIIQTIQQLEPAGIAARSLQECLILQLKALKSPSKEVNLARRILENYFTEFTKRHFNTILSKMGICEDELKDALEVIVSLSPKPANGYSEDSSTDISPSIIPDFKLNYHSDTDLFELELGGRPLPELKVNKDYLRMAERALSIPQKSEQDKEAIDFVRGKIESAKWFIAAIKQRQQTLLSTVNSIIEFQREYFKDGDGALLKPMILRDIAQSTGFDISTISRVVSSKYIETHFGVYLLKYFFSEGLATQDGGEVSTREIKRIIAEQIENESKRDPLTDEALMEMLHDKGFKIARRTVAKYREMLGIPVARLRREL